MKKKTQSFKQDFKMPHLYREDLEEIEAVMKIISPRLYKLETKDFEYTSIQDIPKDALTVSNFHIQTLDPYISIDFENFSSRIYSNDEDDIKTLGAIHKITGIIEKRERRSLWRSSKLSTFLAPVVILSPFLLMEFYSKEIIKSNAVLFVILISVALIMGTVWFVIGYRATLKNYSVIEFTCKKNIPNFFARNKDQIIVGIIVAIMTVVLTVLFQNIFKL